MADDFDAAGFAADFQRFTQAMYRLAGEGKADHRLADAIQAHLGTADVDLPIVEETFPTPDHPNLQLALEAVAEASGAWQLFGLPVDVMHWSGFGLANLASPPDGRPPFAPIAPAYVRVAIDVDRTLPCVQLGLWLLRHDGEPVVVLESLGDPHRGMNVGVRLEVMAGRRDTAVAVLAHLRQLAHEHNVYRGKVLSFTFSEWGAFGLEFHRLPSIARDDVVLPEEDLIAIERHTVGIAEHGARLVAAGRHLKRGLLLYGPPGTGKTFTVMYLSGRMAGRTTLLLSGQAAPTLGQAAAIARSLQPSMLVLEDVDLVAMERTLPGMDSNPLLFQLLNEMDGLDEDADVIFVLTTNRVDLLEPALASRPGRIDQAVEIRLPDEACRRRLLDRYLAGMDLEAIDVDSVVARTEGVSAAFLKELGRRAALVAADASPTATTLVVTGDHVTEALDDLLERSSAVVRRTLGAGVSDGSSDALEGPES